MKCQKQCPDSVLRAQHRPLRVTTCKVNVLDLQHSTDISRCDFDSSVSTLGSMGLSGTIRIVSWSLCGTRTVSHSRAVLIFAGTNLILPRRRLRMSNDPIRTF